MQSSLYKLLADGEFHSGEELGRALGVSRTAVWKQLKKLEERGVVLEKVRGKGYRLGQSLDLLSQEAIEAALAGLGCGGRFALDVRDEVGSTNTEVLLADAPAGLIPVCTAESQTAGRGRRGKSWVSPYAGNLYFSLLWQFEGGAAALEGLSLAVGVALARVIKRQGGEGVGLKWPNDVHHRGGKLAGVLLELQGDPDGRCGVVIGIGINVRMPASAAAAIDQQWTDLETALPGLTGRSELLAHVLAELHEVISEFESGGFSPFREEWQSLDVCAGEPVLLQMGAASVEGVAAGVTERGALRLDRGGVIEEHSGGEVSLRLQ